MAKGDEGKRGGKVNEHIDNQPGPLDDKLTAKRRDKLWLEVERIRREQRLPAPRIPLEGPFVRGKRPDQLAYSAWVIVIAAIVAIGFVVGATLAEMGGMQ